MPVIEIPIPIEGKSEGLPVDKEKSSTSGYMNNCRPKFDGRLILAQRPGMKKAYSQQIGGDDNAIVWMGSVTTVD